MILLSPASHSPASDTHRMRYLAAVVLLMRIVSATEVEVRVVPERVVLTDPRDGLQQIGRAHV